MILRKFATTILSSVTSEASAMGIKNEMGRIIISKYNTDPDLNQKEIKSFK